MKPTISNHGMILAKEQFVDKKDIKKTDNIRLNKSRDNIHHGKKKVS